MLRVNHEALDRPRAIAENMRDYTMFQPDIQRVAHRENMAAVYNTKKSADLLCQPQLDRTYSLYKTKNMKTRTKRLIVVGCLVIALLVYVTVVLFYPSVELHAVDVCTILPPTEVDQPIVIYFHVCMMGDWENIVLSMLSSMEQSGLMDHSMCHIVALGSDESLITLSNMVQKYPTVNIRLHEHDMTTYERTTLRVMWDDCAQAPSNFKVLYVHSKGVSRDMRTPMGVNITKWTQFMSYYLITKADVPIRLLDAVDVVGVNYRRLGCPHFSGNFWWATSRYIATLPREIGPAYLAPEFWLFRSSPRFVTLMQGVRDTYATPMNQEDYENTYRSFSNIVIGEPQNT